MSNVFDLDRIKIYNETLDVSGEGIGMTFPWESGDRSSHSHVIVAPGNSKDSFPIGGFPIGDRRLT